MAECRVGVLGATSMVGVLLLSRLTQAGKAVTAFSRSTNGHRNGRVEWRCLRKSDPGSQVAPAVDDEILPLWICVAPIWALPEHFALLKAYGARRIVTLSSTSRFTKNVSSDPAEQEVARRLTEAEAQVQTWAESHGMEWVILRPTLIYGLGLDRNIAEISRFIRRFGFFPLFGKANGLRQPLHVQDVADACVAALETSAASNRAYNISGGESVSYREMVARIFYVMGRRPRMLPMPLFVFRLVSILLRFLPRYRHWSVAMAERMSRDLVFDHNDATRDLAFKPRAFLLSAEDISV